MTEAYPLYWPSNRGRTPSYKRTRARFKTTFGAAVDFIINELRLLGARHPVISTNVQLRRDGLPSAAAGARNVYDSGVAIYFFYKERETCMTCDRWDKVEDNIYAIGKSIEAMRGIARWGSGDMLEAAFAGFVALPDPKSKWREVLGFPSTLDAAENQYRFLSKKHHPDMPGGDAAMMAKLNEAIEMARKDLSPRAA